MRYTLRRTYPEGVKDPAWFDSLGEVFISLKDDDTSFMSIDSEDGKQHYTGPETRVKAEIAWDLLNIKFDHDIPKKDFGKLVEELKRDFIK